MHGACILLSNQPRALSIEENNPWGLVQLNCRGCSATHGTCSVTRARIYYSTEASISLAHRLTTSQLQLKTMAELSSSSSSLVPPNNTWMHVLYSQSCSVGVKLARMVQYPKHVRPTAPTQDTESTAASTSQPKLAGATRLDLPSKIIGSCMHVSTHPSLLTATAP